MGQNNRCSQFSEKNNPSCRKCNLFNRRRLNKIMFFVQKEQIFLLTRTSISPKTPLYSAPNISTFDQIKASRRPVPDTDALLWNVQQKHWTLYPIKYQLAGHLSCQTFSLAWQTIPLYPAALAQRTMPTRTTRIHRNRYCVVGAHFLVEALFVQRQLRRYFNVHTW